MGGRRQPLSAVKKLRVVGEYVFALVAPRLEDYAPVLRAAFSHPWVASYGVGFGPPLVRANARLVDALKDARSALDKLEAYLRHCIVDDLEQVRLAGHHRAIVVRHHGPLEAEEVALRSSDALDLSLRLHRPAEAPAMAQDQMLARGLEAPEDADPEVLTGRFLIRLDDPKNERLLSRPDIASQLNGHGEAAIELRVHPAARAMWKAFIDVLETPVPLGKLEVGEPTPRAYVVRDGQRA